MEQAAEAAVEENLAGRLNGQALGPHDHARRRGLD